MSTELKYTRNLSEIAMFQTYTYESYKKEFGVEPPYDPELPLKFWFDPAAADPKNTRRNMVYDNVVASDDSGMPLLDGNNAALFEPLVIPKARAATVNIPPQHWEVSPDKNNSVVMVPLHRTMLGPDEFVGVATPGGPLFIINRRLRDEFLAKPANKFEEFVIDKLRRNEEQLKSIRQTLKEIQDVVEG